ncbi:MAG: 1-acyl-sn-glycerol-3-phosphate acyltransferase [Deltaproteobacteria bacterium]|jgi:lysophosphatidate acyltransferase|nr:1-acyl-sn-glycerol-3-phosphate acyltransferase [Deltaproteobacteria bacterium]
MAKVTLNERLGSILRLTIGLLFIGSAASLAMVVLVFLLPWHHRRIRFTNYFGHVVGRGIMKISGCPMTIRGRENVDRERPAIYAGNHTSIYDAFTSIWLSPIGTVGVAKKEIIWYPFYGVAWLLAGHLTLDRGNSEKARSSMRRMGEFLNRHRLHLFMWPEGTRAKDGRLLNFKKGIVHLAIQTKMPIVPMVTEGAHRAWEKASLTLRQVPITITFLPAIDTSHWTEDRIEEHLAELRDAFLSALPTEQQPLQPAVELAAA